MFKALKQLEVDYAVHGKVGWLQYLTRHALLLKMIDEDRASVADAACWLFMRSGFTQETLKGSSIAVIATVFPSVVAEYNTERQKTADAAWWILENHRGDASITACWLSASSVSDIIAMRNEFGDNKLASTTPSDRVIRRIPEAFAKSYEGLGHAVDRSKVTVDLETGEKWFELVRIDSIIPKSEHLSTHFEGGVEVHTWGSRGVSDPLERGSRKYPAYTFGAGGDFRELLHPARKELADIAEYCWRTYPLPQHRLYDNMMSKDWTPKVMRRDFGALDDRRISQADAAWTLIQYGWPAQALALFNRDKLICEAGKAAKKMDADNDAINKAIGVLDSVRRMVGSKHYDACESAAELLKKVGK